VPADITPIWTTSPSELRWPLAGPIHFGETDYPLRRPIVGIYETWDGTWWTFRVEAPEPRFLRFGVGTTEEDAYHHWCQELHVDFQRLFHTSPMTMTDPDDQAQWKALSGLIDVPAYEASRPLTGREVGCVVGTEPGAWTVQWHGQLEKLPLDRMPPEFAMLK
jgi:hypothetical protein